MQMGLTMTRSQKQKTTTTSVTSVTMKSVTMTNLTGGMEARIKLSEWQALVQGAVPGGCCRSKPL